MHLGRDALAEGVLAVGVGPVLVAERGGIGVTLISTLLRGVPRLVRELSPRTPACIRASRAFPVRLEGCLVGLLLRVARLRGDSRTVVVRRIRLGGVAGRPADQKRSGASCDRDRCPLIPAPSLVVGPADRPSRLQRARRGRVWNYFSRLSVARADRCRRRPVRHRCRARPGCAGAAGAAGAGCGSGFVWPGGVLTWPGGV